MYLLKNIIIQKESESGVKQWRFDKQQAITFVCMFFIITGVSLFLVADNLRIICMKGGLMNSSQIMSMSQKI